MPLCTQFMWRLKMKSNPSGTPAHLGRWLHRAAALCISLTLAACGGGAGDLPIAASPNAMKLAATATVAAPDIVVTGITKLSETRVSRTVYDYVFQVTVKNNGTDAKSGVAATLTGVGVGTTIVDGAVTVGNMTAGQTATPTDSITLRQDRTKPFLSTALVWGFTSETGGGGPTVPGILLPGAPTDLASAHLEPYVAPRTAADMQTTAVPNDGTYFRTQIYAEINDNATVGQVNNALSAVGGRIGFIAKNSPVVTIQVPDPGSVAALRGISNALVNSGAFESAGPVVKVVPKAIPNNVNQADAIIPGSPVFHHLAARFAGLWNLNNVQVDPAAVQFVVVDYFGNEPIAAGLLSGPVRGIESGHTCEFKDADGNPFLSTCEHGYHVLGILAGSFGGVEDSDEERVTGAVRFPLPIHVIDLSALPAEMHVDEYIVNAFARIFNDAPNSKFVVNMSIGYECSADTGDCVTTDTATIGARWWRRRVRNIWSTFFPGNVFPYEKQVIQVSAAGNNGPTSAAMNDSAYNAAVLMGQINNRGPLTNGLVVEDRMAVLGLTSGIPMIDKPSPSSATGGNIAAIGTDVFSFTGTNSSGHKSGTSMATPQVAGLVGSMWAIRSTTSPQDLISKVKSKRFIADTSTAPAIDAYAAMLSMDNGMTDAPVRQALLRASVTSPGAASKMLMTSDDVKLFLTAYFPAGYPPASPAIFQPAFSRYDLNGDGYDGEVGRPAPFDMQFDGALQPFAPTRIEFYSTSGSPKIKLDEAAATDFQLLCYYINSPLFDATHKPAVDAELLQLTNALGRKISCNDRTVVLEVKDFSFGWIGLPATITLKNFVTPFPATFAGNSSTCTNQGAVAGERGIPLFSTSVPSPVLITAAIEVSGVPQPTTGGAINRRNCSSFFAESASQVWINATGRAVFGFGGAFVSDWEYQVRYTNGLQGVGKRCTVGVVPNSNFFGSSFESSVCTHEVTATVAE